MPEDRAKLLVVDDNESNLDVLLGLLDAYDVIVALDGKSALDLLKYETPDAILLDIVMPGIDGYEVCTRIKEDPRWRDIPILFITAKTDETSLVRAVAVCQRSIYSVASAARNSRYSPPSLTQRKPMTWEKRSVAPSPWST